MSLPDTSVVYFNSAMSGAPVLSGTAGALIAVLDACLVNGFGTVSVSSLTVASNVATLVVSTGHGISMYGASGPVIEIAGATTQPALNARWRVASVPNATTLTFVTDGVADHTATGTITVKRAAAAWVKSFSGTNLAAYGKLSLGATAMLLRVDDTPAQYPTLTMYESMSDINTGIGSSGIGYTAKSAAASAASRSWVVAASDRALHVFIDSVANSNWASGFSFFDWLRYQSTAAYACALWCHASATTNYHPLYTAENGFRKVCRSYTQVGGPVVSHWRSAGVNYQNLGYYGPSTVNPGDNAIHVWPLELWEGTSGASVAALGLIPGVWNPQNSSSVFPQGSSYTNFSGLDGRSLLAQKVAMASYCGLIDVTGPWQ